MISTSGSVRFWRVTTSQLTQWKAPRHARYPPSLFKFVTSKANSPLAFVKLKSSQVYTINGEVASSEKNLGRSTVGSANHYRFAALESNAGYIYFWSSRSIWEYQNTIYQGTGTCPAMISIETGHTDKITCLTLCQDSGYFVTGSVDTTLRVHDMSKTLIQGGVKPHRSRVHSLTFTLDGKRIASADLDGLLCIWDVRVIDQ